MKILVVEDEDPKRANILAALSNQFPSFQPKIARSVSSAIKFLREEVPELILLDMSLPTFDIGPQESGGRPQGFGGIEVLRYIDRFELDVPVIVVTAYEAFAKAGQQIDLNGLANQLSDAHPVNFRGIVYYNSVFEAWREELFRLMEDVVVP
ncbi:response regulator [Caulobacter sp. SLTY]|uniref:response regulator n=1 Tax=Caulobacter sp. SLTY TaxID=2683262 RepID=UPI00141228DE|nr:response regulator [Caulobacter sp. SLTY]NBB16589.1 response regulator [Caulobacter sp. SLTY]